MATEIERETVDKLNESVSALSLNVARLSERLDAQGETMSANMARLSDRLDAQNETMLTNMERLSDRLDAQREHFTEAMRASQEETRRLMVEQNAAHAKEMRAALDRVNERIDRVEERAEERFERVETRIDRVNERIDETFGSLSTKIHWALGVGITLCIGAAGILARLFFG